LTHFIYSKVPLLRSPMGPTQSGLNSESVLIARPYGMIYSVSDKTNSCTWWIWCIVWPFWCVGYLYFFL